MDKTELINKLISDRSELLDEELKFQAHLLSIAEQDVVNFSKIVEKANQRIREHMAYIDEIEDELYILNEE